MAPLFKRMFHTYLSIYKGENFSYIIPKPLIEVKAKLSDLLATEGLLSFPNITGSITNNSFIASNRWGAIMKPYGPEARISGELAEIDPDTTRMDIYTNVHINFKIFAIAFPLCIVAALFMYLVRGEKIVSNLPAVEGAVFFSSFMLLFTLFIVFRAYSVRKNLREGIEKLFGITPIDTHSV